MRRILFFLSLIVFLGGCRNSTRQAPTEDTTTLPQSNPRLELPNPEKYEHDGYAQLPDSLRPLFLPDTSIGQVSLQNPTEALSYLGTDIMDRLAGNPASASILSSDQKQRLTVFHDPQSAPGAFSSFYISYNRNNEPLPSVADEVFATENKIELGMTMGMLKAIKGDPQQVTTGDITTFHYVLDGTETSNFLNKYERPRYEAKYGFLNGYLVEFSFGFLSH